MNKAEQTHDTMLAALERVAEMFKQKCDPSVQGIACDVFNAIAEAKRGGLE